MLREQSVNFTKRRPFNIKEAFRNNEANMLFERQKAYCRPSYVRLQKIDSLETTLKFRFVFSGLLFWWFCM